MITRIVAALDASPRAAGVFWTVAELARRFDADVHPLRVIQIPPEFPPAAHVTHSDPLPARMVVDAEDSLRKLTAFATDVRVRKPIVREGQPWRVIIAVADEIGADLIVVGSHGYHGIDRVLGTTAGKVANLARHDVYVVHSRVELPSSDAMVAEAEPRSPYR
jgi:nucleotide-binding universal stress UspA family protein